MVFWLLIFPPESLKGLVVGHLIFVLMPRFFKDPGIFHIIEELKLSTWIDPHLSRKNQLIM